MTEAWRVGSRSDCPGLALTEEAVWAADRREEGTSKGLEVEAFFFTTEASRTTAVFLLVPSE